MQEVFSPNRLIPSFIFKKLFNTFLCYKRRYHQKGTIIPFRQKLLILIIASLSVLAPEKVYADIPIPTLMYVFPGMIYLLLPIVILEGWVGVKKIGLDWKKAFHISITANLSSTLLGVPFTYLIFGGAAYSFYGSKPAEPLKTISMYLLQPFLWFPDMEPWVYPISILALLVPMFFVTVWVEQWIAGKMLKERTDSKIIAKKWSRLANLASYILIALVLTGYIIIESHLSSTQDILSTGPTPIPQGVIVENEIKKLSHEHGSFGNAVFSSGEFAVIGAYGDNSGTGSVFIFQRDRGGQNNWGLVKKIIASDGNPEDNFGISVSLNGDTLVIGAVRAVILSAKEKSGAVYIFQKNYGGENNWGEVKKILAPDGYPGDNFGISVSISGNTLVVGNPACIWCNVHPLTDAAYIFERHHGGTDNWGQTKKLIASDGKEGDEYGHSVYTSGDTVVVSAVLDDDEGFNSGSAYIYQRNGGGIGNWGKVKKITATDGSSDDHFGHALSITEDTVVISASYSDSHAGSIYIFRQNNGGHNNWGLVQKLTAFDRTPNTFFGYSVGIEKDSLIVVDAHKDGTAYFFQTNKGDTDSWKLRKLLTPYDFISNNESKFTYSNLPASTISINSDYAVVGGRGQAYIYHVKN